MKYLVKFTNQFKKDMKLAKKQNKNLDKLFEVVNIIADGGTLDARYRDHDLSGNYKGTREYPGLGPGTGRAARRKAVK